MPAARARLFSVLLFCSYCFAQQGQTAAASQPATTSADQPAAASGTVLKVAPGAPVIKPKDLYDATGYGHPFTRIPKYVWKDQKAIWSSPFHTSKANAKWWFVFGGAAGALIAADKNIVKGLPTSGTDVSVSNWASRVGSAYSVIPMSAAFYLLGTHNNDTRLRETGLIGFETLIDTNLAVQAFKLTADRARPYEGNGSGRFEDSALSRWDTSFPSGHSIDAWAMASVVAHEYRHKKIVPILAYALAATVSVARVGARQHFPSDVLVGGGMGWFIGDYVFGKRHDEALDDVASATP